MKIRPLTEVFLFGYWLAMAIVSMLCWFGAFFYGLETGKYVYIVNINSIGELYIELVMNLAAITVSIIYIAYRVHEARPIERIKNRRG